MFIVAQLLLPISAADSCGADISFSAEVDAIARARQYDDPTLAQGEWVVALKEADWPFVASRCARLIETHSKDLRLAVWLAEAQAKTRRFRGLGDGYAVLAGLCQQYWAGLHPQPEGGEYEQRVGNLAWLLARTPLLVKQMALTEGTPYALADFDSARQRGIGAVTDVRPPQNWGAPTPDSGPALADLDAERRRNSARFNAALLADVQYCLDALGQLEGVIDERLGAAGPGFSAAREALADVIHFIAPLTPTAPAAAPRAMAALPAAVPLPAQGASGGAPHSRAQALAQLRQVAEFFRATEPHSPVAYLADKAARWGELPLHLWLRSVIKDPAAIAGLDELLGADGP
ncbi:type VI secretion system protein TssA [Rugamonas sp.]|uniref:type VI secretion system protein TssA n=1 Tax=Rugamonas sp. TaxID=1926287 RepID=UPI0025D89561|nr:type VI secretion system protein TssA [Rugamonas sp.]